MNCHQIKVMSRLADLTGFGTRHWTSTIAYTTMLDTCMVYRLLRGLERQALVERHRTAVNDVQWSLTPFGRDTIAAHYQKKVDQAK